MRMIRLVSVLVFGLAIAVSLAGCKSNETRKRADAISYSMQVYLSLIRWGEWADAAAYHKPREGEPVLPDYAKLEGLRVTKAEMLGSAGDADAGEVVAEIRLEYHRDYSVSIRTLNQRQTWWYSEEDGRWWLDSPFPEFQTAR